MAGVAYPKASGTHGAHLMGIEGTFIMFKSGAVHYLKCYRVRQHADHGLRTCAINRRRLIDSQSCKRALRLLFFSAMV